MEEGSLGGCEDLGMMGKFGPEMRAGEENNGFEIGRDGGCGKEVVVSEAGIVERLLGDDSAAVEFGCRGGSSLGTGVSSSAPDGNAASPEVKSNDSCTLEDPGNVRGDAVGENMETIISDYVSSVDIPRAGVNDEGCDFPCLSPIRMPTGNGIANSLCLDPRPGIRDTELHSDHRDHKESQEDSDRPLRLVVEHSFANVAAVSAVSSTTFQTGCMDGRCKDILLSGLKNSSFKENGTDLVDVIDDNQLSYMDDSGVVSPNNSSAEEGKKVAGACYPTYESCANVQEVYKEVKRPTSENCSLSCEKSDNAVCCAAEEEYSSRQCFSSLVDYHKPKQFSTSDNSKDDITSTCPQLVSRSVGVSCDQTDSNGIGNVKSDSILIYRRCNPKRAASLKNMSSVSVPPPKISTKSVRKSKEKVKDNTISSNISLLNSFKMASRKKSSHRTGRVSVWGTIEKLHAMFSHSNGVSNGTTELNEVKKKIRKARHNTGRRRSKSQKCGRVKGVSCAPMTDGLSLNEHRITQFVNPTSEIFTSTCPIGCLPHNNSESRTDAPVNGCSPIEFPIHQRILENPVLHMGKDVRRSEKDLESSLTLETSFENNTTDLHGISSQLGYETMVDVGDDKLVHNPSTSPESDIIHPISEAGILVNDFNPSTRRNVLGNLSVSNSSVQDNSHTGICKELNVMTHMPLSKHKKKGKVKIHESSRKPSEISNQEKETNDLVQQCKTRKPARHRSKSNKKLQTDSDGRSSCGRKGRRKSLQKASNEVEFLEEKSSLVKAELLSCEETLNAQTCKQKLVSLEKCAERDVASKSANVNVARKSKCTTSSRTKKTAERRKKKDGDPCTKKKTKRKELLGHMVVEKENELLASCAEENGAPFGRCLETGHASFLGGMHEPNDLNDIRNNNLGDVDGDGTGCEVLSQKSRSSSNTLPNDEKMLENSLGGEMQLLPPQVGWVCCDNCNKWRCIPAALVDIIRETNCKWTCKDNNNKAFADCSIPQEKTNAEINAELEISDASGEDDFHGPRPNSKMFNHAKPSATPPLSWKRIKSNDFLHRNRKTQSIDEVMVCFCKPPLDGSLGCGDGCLNRMLNIECVRGTCPCGDQCSNRQFQKRKYAKLKCIPCGKKGDGLQLQEKVSEGDFLIEYVGEVLDLATYEARQKDYASRGQRHFYFMTLNGSEVIDACMKGNLGRFINHSCEPNCRTEKWMVNGEICIGLFAVRDIKKGEELTFNYNYVRVFGAAAKKCICGSAECQGYIGGDPLNGNQIVVQDDTDEEYLEPLVGCADSQREAQMDKITLGTTDKTAKQPEDNVSKLGTDENLQDVIDVISIQHKEKSTKQSETVVKSTLTEPELESAPKAASASSGSLPSGQELELASEVSNITNKILPDSNHTNANINLTILTNEDNTSTVKPCESKKSSIPDGPTKKGQTGVPKFLSHKAKKFLGNGSHTDNSDEVAKKLNELTGADGGICKRKDAAKGYLKLLVVTAADNVGTATIHSQSTRDLSLILDALLKTKSRAVLLDMVNKNGLQILHNIMKQNRKNNNKIPILRKLLKVLKYLVEGKVLTQDQINMIPSCPGVESFQDSIIHLTHHNNKEVHHAAREFRDKWLFRASRKTNPSDVDGGHGLYDSHNMKSNWSLTASNQHQDARDDACSCISQKIHLPSVSSGFDVMPETSAPSQESGNTISSAHDGLKNETKHRKRKSRWDQDEPPKKVRKDRQCMGSDGEKNPELAKQDLTWQHENNDKSGVICSTHVAVNAHDSSLQDINEAPPGFDFPPAHTSLSSTSRQSNCQISDVNSEVVIGKQQEKYLHHLAISRGIPLALVQQLGTPVDGHNIDFLRWNVAPGMPFHPFPPLPTYPRVSQNECSSHCSNHLVLSSVCTGSSSCQSHVANGVMPFKGPKFEAVNLENDERGRRPMDVHGRKLLMRHRRHNHDHRRSLSPWHCERSGFESRGNRRHGMH